MSRSFNGTDQYFQGPAVYGTGVPMTVSFWFTIDSLAINPYPWIYTVDASSNKHYILIVGTAANDPIYVGSQAGVDSAAIVPVSGLTVGPWYHLAATFTDTQRRVLFGGSYYDASTTPLSFGTFARLTFGAAWTSGGAPAQHHDGDLAEMATWNILLSDPELESLAKGFSPKRVRPSALVHYCPFYGSGTNENSVKGTVFTNNNSSTKGAGHPRIFG